MSMDLLQIRPKMLRRYFLVAMTLMVDSFTENTHIGTENRSKDRKRAALGADMLAGIILVIEPQSLRLGGLPRGSLIQSSTAACESLPQYIIIYPLL